MEQENPELENVEKTVPTQKKQKKRVERIARCNVCSNEWKANNGDEEKPSRCPACKSRDVSWRDECKNAEEPTYEITYAVNSQDAGKPLFHAESENPANKTDENDYAERDAGKNQTSANETTLEKIKAGLPKIPIQTVVITISILAVLGAILFLERKMRANREARIRQMQTAAAQRQPQQQPMPSGTAAAILRQKGLIGGYR